MKRLQSPNRRTLLVIFIFISIFAVNFLTLLRYPPLFVDEAWYTSRAWTFKTTGIIDSTLDKGVIDKYEGYWTTYPWFSNFFMTLSLLLLSEPALFPIRMVSLVFSMGLLACVYAITTKLADWRAGLLSVLILALSPPFIISSHLGRYDMMIAFWGHLAFTLFVFDRSLRSFLLGCLSGFAIGLAVESHLNGAIFAPPLILLYLILLNKKMVTNRSAWGFGTAGVICIAGYAWLHILRYPETYASVMSLIYSSTHTPPLLTFDLAIIGRALYEFGFQALVNIPFLIIFCVVALVFMLWHRSTADRPLFLFVVTLLASYALLVHNKSSYYGILFTPGLAMLVGYFAIRFYDSPWRGRLVDYAVRMSWVMIALSLVFSVWMMGKLFSENWYDDYIQITDRMAASIQPGDVLMGPQTYWIEYYQHYYYSWEQLVYYHREHPDSQVQDALYAMHPDIIIIDDRVFLQPDSKVITDPYMQNVRVSLEEMNAFLAAHASLVDTIPSEPYGQINLYRIDW